MNIPETEQIVSKFSSKKFGIAMTSILAIWYIDVPVDFIWVKIVGIAAIAVAEIYFQARLDNTNHTE